MSFTTLSPTAVSVIYIWKKINKLDFQFVFSFRWYIHSDVFHLGGTFHSKNLWWLRKQPFKSGALLEIEMGAHHMLISV